MQANQDVIQLEYGAARLYVDSNVLEKMKAALLSFLDGSKFPTQVLEHRDPMRAELLASSVWIHEGQSGVGPWKLTSESGSPVLVRYPPPRKGTMYLYHATMGLEGSEWRVLAFDQEREFGPD